MDTNSTDRYDFLAIGEVLVDLIASDPGTSLAEATTLHRYAGGQATNLARNMALLGNRVALSACVGDDGFGRFLRQQVGNSGVDISNLQTSQRTPTTLVCVTKTPGGTPEFLVYRGADAQLAPTLDLKSAVKQSRIVHTSAFALACNPSRDTILECLHLAHQAGKIISLDPNYHERIWSDIPDFINTLQAAFALVDVAKPSLDDCHRLFGPGESPQQYSERFLSWGASTVVLTMGSEGVFVATRSGERIYLPSHPVMVMDVTGAGDAFWAGLLTGLLHGLPAIDAARAGQVLAEVKIGSVGPMTHAIDFEAIKAQVQSFEYPTQP
ncbi:MAG: carbohydrate kinase family protein [Anaerolineales bacterium]|nr:carbohydrate kinase family protein [Anaerolineales bacterium]